MDKPIRVDTYKTYILQNGQLNTGMSNVTREETEIITAIIQRKGWFRSTNGKDSGDGMYMPGTRILEIIQEGPEWLRTKVASNKFGI